MNKVWTENPAGKLLICILEPGNIHKLVDKRLPIEFSLNEGPYEKGLPAKLSVAIMYSATPAADADELRKMLTPPAVAIDTRTPQLERQRPHCPECKSTIEQLGMLRNDSPIVIIYCPVCGCALGTAPRTKEIEELAR